MKPFTRVTINCHSTDILLGSSLLAASRQIGAPLPSACGGNAVCKKCAVEIIEGENHLSIYTDDEEYWRKKYKITTNKIRLGCQAKVLGPVQAISKKIP